MEDPALDVAGARGSSPSLRWIERRVRVEQHRPIARLISPDGLGERLKPFIFLDHFNGSIEPGFGFGMHPHSGIATLTWQPGTDVRYRDTTGKNGVLKAGGLEWMNAGDGAWHEATLLGSGHVTGFQLWVPMPPGVEDGPSLGQHVPPEDVPRVAFPGGTVAVLLGSMETPAGVIASPIESHQEMNYVVVSLEAGATWRYEPPVTHDVAWAFAFEGRPLVQGEEMELEFVVMAGTAPSSCRRRPAPPAFWSELPRDTITTWSSAPVRFTRTPPPWRGPCHGSPPRNRDQLDLARRIGGTVGRSWAATVPGIRSWQRR